MLSRTARIPATYGELPDAASQIVASFDGPFTAGGGRGAGVRVSTVVAEPGHPLVRLAGQIAQTDFAATYLAIGLGLDPAVSPHVADLRDRTRG